MVVGQFQIFWYAVLFVLIVIVSVAINLRRKKLRDEKKKPSKKGKRTRLKERKSLF